jgi:dTDP-4-amino-4,6-dideoxygalactose transaminase
LSDRIYLSSPHMSDEGYEMQYIKEAFDTNWIAPLGPNVNEFEKELAAKGWCKIMLPHYHLGQLLYIWHLRLLVLVKGI